MNKYIVICVFASASVFANVVRAKDAYWIAGGSSCRRDYGEEDRCIHHSYCEPNKDGSLPRGYPEFCRFSGIRPILCCIENDKLEKSSEEEYSFDDNKDYKKFPPLNRDTPDKNKKVTPHTDDKNNKNDKPVREAYHDIGPIWDVASIHDDSKKHDHTDYHNWPHNQHDQHGYEHSPKYNGYHHNEHHGYPHKQEHHGYPYNPTYDSYSHSPPLYYNPGITPKPPAPPIGLDVRTSAYDDDEYDENDCDDEDDSIETYKKMQDLLQHVFTPITSKPHLPQAGSYPLDWPLIRPTGRPTNPQPDRDNNKGDNGNGSNGNAANGIGANGNDDTSNRAPGSNNGGTSQTTSINLPSNSTEGLNIQVPYYRPTVANSTSLRRCIQYFRQVPILKGRHTPVIGGRDARPKEFPHLAVLGYGQPDAIRWLCGGSLISENYVLTAAHCIFPNALGQVSYVRLGELDLNSTTDDADERDFTVAQVILHPLYDPRYSYHDIALIRLNASVERFTSYIRPVCLPTTRFLENATLVVAGWGLTEVGGDQPSILQRATLKHVDNARCRRSYERQKKLPNEVQEEIQVCADGGSERRDTCQGDSGGPMQYTNWDYETPDFLGFVEVAGITSVGRGCGLTAGVYTRVLPYVRWIESIVFPN